MLKRNVKDELKREIEKPLTKVVNGYTVPFSCEEEVLKLASLNNHVRDGFIVFDEIPHLYYIKGKSGYTSATTFIHHFFNDFDGQKIASAMVIKKTFTSDPPLEKYMKYQPMRFDTVHLPNGKKKRVQLSNSKLVRRIIDSWEKDGDKQSSLGTVMHRQIELFYNDALNEKEEECIQKTKEFGLFETYHAEIQSRSWQAFRTEMIVWDEETQLCGSIDMIYIDTSLNQDLQAWRDGKITLRVRLVDWKRSKGITTGSYGKFGKGPCCKLPDANFYHYKIQLNLYRYMLEKNYNVQVDSMAICVCHPKNDVYNEFVVGDEQELIRSMVQERIDSNK
jgi:hypothetical protein